MTFADEELNKAKLAVRDAKINKDVENNENMIAINGRCGKYNGHFDFASFGIAVFFTYIITTIFYLGMLGMHR